MDYMVEFDITRALTVSTESIFRDFNEMKAWCEENLQGSFQGGGHSLATRTGIFRFELEIDAVAFKLRWL